MIRKDAQSLTGFTNLFSLSKTLQFELIPVGKTLQHMKEDLRFDESLQTFLSDQEIEHAYQTLKPHIDKLHEEFIGDSLESASVQSIDFDRYLQLYRRKKDLAKNEIGEEEKILRRKIGKGFDETAEHWKKKYAAYKWKKGTKEVRGPAILTCQCILEIVKDSQSGNAEIRKMVDERLQGFFTYFYGYNENRMNYYEVEKEAMTAVASRIVHENLPRFCDNVLAFESESAQYLNIYKVLSQKNIALVDKNGKQLSSIREEVFQISEFGTCLSQPQIEAYNLMVGDANFLINLYNQTQRSDKNFKSLRLFKTLYKQIGCGVRKDMFMMVTHGKKADAKKNNVHGISVEELLDTVYQAGRTFFIHSNMNDLIQTVPQFMNYMEEKNDYDGIFFSKTAINTLSGKYFANWHILQDILIEKKIFSKNAETGEPKIPDAVELDELFGVLETEQDWKTLLFKKGIVEQKHTLINTAKTPGQAILKMLFDDMRIQINAFFAEWNEVEKLPAYDMDIQKEQVKKWLDHVLAICRMLGYFQVKENTIKTPMDPVVAEALKTLLRSDAVQWFDWYDAVRNFLTKKPQEDVKKNKLKLNFENGSLLGGWSDGEEKVKSAVILKHKNNYYLGVLIKRSLFDTTKKENPIYLNSTAESGRLIIANLKFQTLAGRGFVSKFKNKYSEIGARDPLLAIEYLKKIIHEKYAAKYPLLRMIADKSYSNKKEFDADIQKTLADCYVCEFTPVHWDEVLKQTDMGTMYLFNIFTKDKSIHSNGKMNLHYLYWQGVFEKDTTVQLNGGGEIFYRRKVYANKEVKEGYEKKPHVIHNRRFTAEKFIFHCPIKLNYKSKSYGKPGYAVSPINEQINNVLLKEKTQFFLGIDRGEKHLAYYSLIDQNGTIHDQGTLNMPFVDSKGSERTVMAIKHMVDSNGKVITEQIACKDYNELLAARAGSRDFARRNWQTIGVIKDLKKGYISQVVRKIADLAIAHKAYIVLEDLNRGFKRGRQKIEKSAYQNLELALAKKLNFLVDKSASSGDEGSVNRAWQLTPPVANYQDIEDRKQLGIMLYTAAHYTSQTDPATGWRKTIYLKSGSDIDKQIFEQFTEIGFDGNDYFFTYDDDKGSGKRWKMYASYGGKSLDRYKAVKGDQGVWKKVSVDLVKELNTLFKNFTKDRSLLQQLRLERQKFSAKNWEELRMVIERVQQIRNSGNNQQDDDFILSPVRDAHGNHFDSRSAGNTMPTCGDANGAYNIARKGIIMTQHMKHGLKLYISNEEWDIWLAGQKRWKEWLDANGNKLKK